MEVKIEANTAAIDKALVELSWKVQDLSPRQQPKHTFNHLLIRKLKLDFSYL
jgi:hypothetical protein